MEIITSLRSEQPQRQDETKIPQRFKCVLHVYYIGGDFYKVKKNRRDNVSVSDRVLIACCRPSYIVSVM